MALPTIASYALPTEAELPDNGPDWTLDPSRAVLLVHDMQRYFLRPYPRDAEPITGARDNIAALRVACRDTGVPAVYTAKPGDMSAAQRGLERSFWGAGMRAVAEHTDIDPALAPGDDDALLTKCRYSAFVRTELAERMAAQGRDQLLITGVYAHIGCQLTAADAFMRDIQPFLVADAVADFGPEHHRAALSYVAGRCGRVLCTRSVVERLKRTGEAAPGLAATMTPPTMSGETTMPEPFTVDRVQAEIAAVLGEPVEEIDVHENLLERGMDSIRLMSLMETWRTAGVEVDLAALVEDPTVTSWAALLAR